MSSIASNMSGMTVSAFGEEDMDFDEAVNKVFGNLQTFVNDCHSGVRTLAMCDERADTYLEALQIWRELDLAVGGALDLFSTLRSISKQVLGRPPKEYKEEASAQIKKWKEEDKLGKERAKAEAKAAKDEAKVNSIQ
jgi:hypothetical protein